MGHQSMAAATFSYLVKQRSDAAALWIQLSRKDLNEAARCSFRCAEKENRKGQITHQNFSTCGQHAVKITLDPLPAALLSKNDLRNSNALSR
nr:hypothetical protein Iba_chr09eCG8980 [Ipomoea batatas]